MQNSYGDLAGKTDEIIARAIDFVQQNKVQGLIVTGGFVTLFNPGLEANVAHAVTIPVTSAVSSVRPQAATLTQSWDPRQHDPELTAVFVPPEHVRN